MEEHDGRISGGRHGTESICQEHWPGPLRLPVLENDVLADVAITEPRQDPEHPLVIRACGEGAAEPRPWVDANDVADDTLRLADVGGDAVVAQERQPSVVEAVISDEMAVGRDAPSELRVGLDPASLEEPCRGDPAAGEDVEDCLRYPRPVGTIGMLRIEGERDPEQVGRLPRPGYFSTPLITMPRVKNRWKTRKITIGMIIVMRVPAWMKAWLR
jgi:hypothetical protein